MSLGKYKVLSMRYKVKSTLYFGLCTLYFFFINEKLPLFEGENAFFPKNMTVEESERIVQQHTSDAYHFKVTPNPTNGNVTFTLEVDNFDNMEIVITDLQGKIIKIVSVSNLTVNFEFTNLPQGIYLAHLTKNGKIQNSKKIVYAL